MKKILIAAAFLAFCTAGSVSAQAPVSGSSTSVSVEKADGQADTKKEPKAASCCSKKSAKASCSDEGKSAKKSSCCQKAGHTDAKVEGTEEKEKSN